MDCNDKLVKLISPDVVILPEEPFNDILLVFITVPTFKFCEKLVFETPSHVINAVLPFKALTSESNVPTLEANPDTVPSKVAKFAEIPATVPPNAKRPAVFAAIAAAETGSNVPFCPGSPLSPLIESPFGPVGPVLPVEPV